MTDTIQELEQLTRRQISEDITGMEEAVNEAKQAAAILEDGKAERILEKLKKGIGTAFPEIPKNFSADKICTGGNAGTFKSRILYDTGN